MRLIKSLRTVFLCQPVVIWLLIVIASYNTSPIIIHILLAVFLKHETLTAVYVQFPRPRSVGPKFLPLGSVFLLLAHGLLVEMT